MIGVIGWAVILAVILLWEGAALMARTPDWPTLSDIMRIASRPLVGRCVLFAIWLWFGWHLFVRGWVFFLRRAPESPSGGAAAPSNPATLLAPAGAHPLLSNESSALFAFYLVLLALLAYCGIRIRQAGRAVYEPVAQGSAEAIGWRVVASHIAVTVIMGYATFVVAMGAYFAVFTSRPTASLVRAAGEALSLTLVVAVPGLVVLTTLYRLGRRRSPAASR